MAVRQEDARSWTPHGVERTEAVAMLAELSAHRPVRPDPSSMATAPTPRPAPPPSSPGPGLAASPGEDPATPGFSPDGRWWWDGRRWTATERLERVTEPGTERRRRRWSPALAWAGGVVVLVALLGLAAAPVLWGHGPGGSDELLQTALLEVAEAQQQHLMDHGRFAADDDALSVYLLRLGGVPEDVALEVRASDELTYCVAATAPDGARLWVTESGTVTTTACG